MQKDEVVSRCKKLFTTLEKNSSFPKNLKIVFFDMDGTLTTRNSFVDLYELAHEHPKDDFWNGYLKSSTMSYKDSLKPLEDGLRRNKVTKDQIQEVFDKAELTDGIVPTVGKLISNDVKCVIVSCGAEELAYRIDGEVKKIYGKGFDKIACLHSEYDKDGRFKEFTPDVDYKAKGIVVKDILKEFGYTGEEAVAVGDSDIDGEMFKECALGLLFNDDPKNHVEDVIRSKYKNINMKKVSGHDISDIFIKIYTNFNP